MNLFNTDKKASKKSLGNNDDSGEGSDFIKDLVEENYRNRFWITIITMFTFLLLMSAIMYSMYSNTPISKDWKEILLLMLGAFIGSYQKIIQFWFDAKELMRDILKIADEDVVRKETIRNKGKKKKIDSNDSEDKKDCE